MGTYNDEHAHDDAAAEGRRAALTATLKAGAEALRAEALALQKRKTELPKPSEDVAGDWQCTMHWAIASGCYGLSAQYQEAGDNETSLWYLQLGGVFTSAALDCEAGAIPKLPRGILDSS